MKWNYHPGSGYIKVCCDVCGKIIYRKDAHHITDKYSLQYGLVVCKADIDKANPQSKPFKITEKGPSHPELLRPMPVDIYADNANDSRVPSVPRNVYVDRHPINNTLYITWDAPLDSGTSGITGYIVKRADPQLGTYTTITSSTDSGALSYEDTTADVDSEYTYIIYAINGYGTSDASYPGFYPAIHTSLSINYLVLSQDESVLTTGGNTYIVVSE